VKVGTSNPDRTISLEMLQCVIENNKYKHYYYVIKGTNYVSLVTRDKPSIVE